MNSLCLHMLLFQCFLAAAAAQNSPLVVRVWPGTPPGSVSHPLYHEDTVYADNGQPRIRRVTDPELSIYLPPGGKQNIPAIIICPGGGYGRLAMDHEGYDVARWLSSAGIAGIVLKYRLPSDSIMTNRSCGPLQDAQEAIRLVRRRAGEWKIDPHRIGIMGFSAGGHLAGSASTLYGYSAYTPQDGTSARPDFTVLVYAVVSMEEGMTHGGSRQNLLGPVPDTASVRMYSAEQNVTSQTPPAFIVHSENDRTVPALGSIAYFTALRKNSVPAELHVYETGSHGYGMAPNGGTESEWPEALKKWLAANGFMP